MKIINKFFLIRKISKAALFLGMQGRDEGGLNVPINSPFFTLLAEMVGRMDNIRTQYLQ